MNKIWKIVPRLKKKEGRLPSESSDASVQNELDDFSELLDRYLSDNLAEEEQKSIEHKAKEFYDSIADQPESSATLRELHEVETGERQRLAERLGFDMPQPALHRQRRASGIIRYTSAAAAFIGVVVGVSLWFSDRTGSDLVADITADASSSSVAITTGNEIRTITTADGSEICLNAGSELTYDTLTFNRRERRVRMPEGEAYFQIAKNPGKPFRIDLGGHTVEVLGTSFNISRYKQLDKCVISVLTGRVRVSDGNGNEITQLPPNSEISINLADGTYSIKKKDCQELTAWTDGGLVLNEASLDEVKMRIERKYGVHITIPRSLAGKGVSLSATYPPTAKLDDVLECIKLMGIDYRRSGDNITFIGEC